MSKDFKFKTDHNNNYLTDSSNTVCEVTDVNKSPPKIWNIVPNIWETFPKKSQTTRRFITSCLLEDFSSLQIPGKILRFPEEFGFSPETDLLIVDTPPPPHRPVHTGEKTQKFQLRRSHGYFILNNKHSNQNQ